MDLYVERQCIDEMKRGSVRQFLLLYDANFEAVYKYVSRRVSDRSEAEKIVRLTFLDALGLVQNTPMDIGYVIWLYGLAKPRIWEYIDRSSFPQKQGLIVVKKGVEEDKKEDDLVEKANKMMGKLSLEEREILRLKLFEQVTDGDVMVILGLEEGTVGQKIYRVLKRAHFLLFGESESKQGVYFGELSGFFERMREREAIEVSDVLKLSLRVDLTSRIDKKNYAIDAEVVKETKKEDKKTEVRKAPSAGVKKETITREVKKEMKGQVEEKIAKEIKKGMKSEVRGPVKETVAKEVKKEVKKGMKSEVKGPMKDAIAKEVKKEMKGEMKGTMKETIAKEVKKGLKSEVRGPVKDSISRQIKKEVKQEVKKKEQVGSNDPAKIFVEAVREMKEEEKQMQVEETERFERRERFYDFVDRWKAILVLIPAVLFVWIVALVLFHLFDFDFRNRVERGYPTECEIEVAFEGDFTDKEKRGINEGVSDRLCGHFEVEKLLISRVDDGIVEVEVDIPDWFLEYKFVRKVHEWRIKKYARTLVSNGESREV